MKFTKYFMPFAALALLASCSNDTIDQPAVQQPVDDTPVEGMYLTFNLALPNSSSTRAEDDPSFGGYEEGESWEYAIENIWLYLYKCNVNAGESAATTLHGAYKLGLGELSNDNTNQDGVTLTQKVTFQIKDLTEGQKDANDFYAFIVVNQPNEGFNAPSGALSVWNTTAANYISADGHATSEAVYNKGEAVTTKVNGMIPIINGKSYFTMTNAPLWNGENVQTLVKLNKDNFAVSPAQATEPAATVYVQRGVAKIWAKAADGVSINAVPVEGQYETEGDKKVYNKVDFKGWMLDVVNTLSYPVQKITEGVTFTNPTTAIANDWAGKFFKSSLIYEDEEPDYCRIWWGEDPNYGEDATLANFIRATDGNSSLTWNEFDKKNWEYCLENTMDFDAMKKDASTRVVFKGLYHIKDKNTGVAVKDPVSFVMYPGTDLAAEIDKDKMVDLELNNIKPNSDGTYKLSDIIKANETKYLSDLMGELQMGIDDDVYYYKDGVTYYTAILRHFNEYETPLTSDGKKADDKNSNVLIVDQLTQYTPFQLGRYGVLRNNVYQVNVAKVMGYGVPFIPTPNDDPDDAPDPIKYNVVLDIKVLDWAKRGFDYTLK